MIKSRKFELKDGKINVIKVEEYTTEDFKAMIGSFNKQLEQYNIDETQALANLKKENLRAAFLNYKTENKKFLDFTRKSIKNTRELIDSLIKGAKDMGLSLEEPKQVIKTI